MSMHRLQLIEIRNPFKPTDADRSTLEFKPGSSVADLYPSAVTNELQIGLNGMIVPLEKRDVTFVADGDYLVICPVVAGGGDSSKTILRVVALIAVSMVAGPAASALYGAMGGTYVAAGAAASLSMLQGGVMIAGGLLVNALIPPPGPKKQADSSATYGIDGAKNTALEGVVVPITYGKFRTAGNIIGNYVVNDGNTQWLYMMINAGEGPIENISDIWINDQPIDTFNLATTPYKDVDYQIRLGEKDQLPVDWFANTVTPQSVNFRLTDTPHQVTTLGEVDQVRLDFTAPAGLSQIDGDGDSQPVSVTLNVQYRVSGTTPWFALETLQEVSSYAEVIEWFTITTYNEAGVASQTTYVPTGFETRVGDNFYSTAGDMVGTARQQANYGAGSKVISGHQSSAMRVSLLSQPLPEAQYDIRVFRQSAEAQLTDPKIVDTIYFSDLNEITLEDVGYCNTATLSLKIRLGDQLNGMPTVTFMHHGKKVKSWNKNTGVWDFNGSPNPAWVAFDILTNARYGGGASVSRFDMDAWKDWADWCATPARNGTSHALEFNGTFDTQSNVWDSNQKVMRCGHASIVRVGTRYTVAIERDESPSMMFSVANMVEGSFEESWSSVTERSNEIEGTFSDKDDSYKPRTIRVYDKAAITAGYPQRSSSVDLMGVTSAQQAWDDLNIMLNLNRYIQRTVKFSATMESLGCSVGSVVNVQHDMPQWGTGGRLEAGSTLSAIQLDREVTLEFGKTYKALIHHSALQRYSGTTGSVVNTSDESSVILVGYNGSTTPARLQVAGKDVEVLSSFTSGPNFGVTVRLIPGLSSGAAYSLWDTDVIETRNVVNPAVSGTPLTVTAVQLALPLSSIPAQFTNFMFGETDKVAKPFRIKSISGSHEYHRDIVATEFNASVYLPAGAVPTPNYSSLPLFVDQVTISGASEIIVPHGISYKSRVTVTYQSDQQTYQTSNVYLSRDFGAYQWVGKDIYSVTVDAVKGEVLRFRVVAMDVVGKSASESGAPTLLYTAVGKVSVPGSVQSLLYEFTDTDILFSFEPPSEQDWLTTQASTAEEFLPVDTILFDAKATTFHWAFQEVGTYPIWFRSLVQHNVPSVPVFVNVVVLAPVAPTITAAEVVNGVLMLTWTSSKTSQPIRSYEVRVGDAGDTWELSASLGRASGSQTAMSVVIPEEGTKQVYIRATDVAGNPSPDATTQVVVSGSSALRLLTDSQTISQSKDGSRLPATIAFTAVFTGALAGAIASFTNSLGVTFSGTNNVRTLTVADIGTSTSVVVTASYTSPGGTVYTDTVTIPVLVDGSDALSVILSNEAHTLSASPEGLVDSFAGADSYISTYLGGVDSTPSWTFTKVDTNVHSYFEPGVPNHVIVDLMTPTKLLLRAEEAASTTVVIDSSAYAHTVVNDGAIALTATNAKFDRAIPFDGNATKYLEVSHRSDFEILDQDFAVQLQVHIPAYLASRQFLIGWWGPEENTENHSWALLVGTDGKLNFDYASLFDVADYTLTSDTSIPTGVVTEVAVGRAGNVLTLKVGTSLKTFAFDKTIRAIVNEFVDDQVDIVVTDVSGRLDQLLVTAYSPTLPVEVTDDSVDLTTFMGSAVMYSWPMDDVDVVPTMNSGVLTTVLQSYTNWTLEPVDAVDIVPGLNSGVLTSVLQTYNNWLNYEDAVDVSPTVVSGTIETVLVTYAHWLNEPVDIVDIAATFNSGTLT